MHCCAKEARRRDPALRRRQMRVYGVIVAYVPTLTACGIDAEHLAICWTEFKLRRNTRATATTQANSQCCPVRLQPELHRVIGKRWSRP